MNEDLFPEVIGQKDAKARLSFFVQSHNATGYVPPIVITAPKGQGKTRMARAFASKLYNKGASVPKQLFKINCANIRCVSQFFSQIIIPHISDGNRVVLFFDEACEIPTEVCKALLTVFEENQTVTEYIFEDKVLIFDLTKVTWIFATSEPQKIFHSLFDRFEQIELVDYNTEDLASIIALIFNSKKYTYEKEAVAEMAKICRGSGRSAAKWAGNAILSLEINASTHFTLNDWKKMRSDFNILPLGLSNRELIVLQTLDKAGQCSLTRLSSIVGLTKEALQKQTEIYLLKLHLMAIETPGGRTLTKQGKQYLEQFKNEPS